MSTSVLVLGAVFIGVALLVVAVAMLLRDKSVAQMEDRLNTLTGKGEKSEGSLAELSALVASQRGDNKGLLERVLSRWFNLTKLFDQAEVTMTVTKFVAICTGIGVGSTMACLYAGINYALAPIAGVTFSTLPIIWLMFKRKRRLKKFAAQLPEALELVARALRAGHSLASGFRLVASEMSDPIGGEFNRVFEEQNLGIPFEEALESLT